MHLPAARCCSGQPATQQTDTKPKHQTRQAGRQGRPHLQDAGVLAHRGAAHARVALDVQVVAQGAHDLRAAGTACTAGTAGSAGAASRRVGRAGAGQGGGASGPAGGAAGCGAANRRRAASCISCLGWRPQPRSDLRMLQLLHPKLHRTQLQHQRRQPPWPGPAWLPRLPHRAAAPAGPTGAAGQPQRKAAAERQQRRTGRRLRQHRRPRAAPKPPGSAAPSQSAGPARGWGPAPAPGTPPGCSPGSAGEGNNREREGKGWSKERNRVVGKGKEGRKGGQSWADDRELSRVHERAAVGCRWGGCGARPGAAGARRASCQQCRWSAASRLLSSPQPPAAASSPAPVSRSSCAAATCGMLPLPPPLPLCRLGSTPAAMLACSVTSRSTAAAAPRCRRPHCRRLRWLPPPSRFSGSSKAGPNAAAAAAPAPTSRCQPAPTCRMPAQKVAVLPVPDCACWITSRPLPNGTMPFCWMADGFSKPGGGRGAGRGKRAASAPAATGEGSHAGSTSRGHGVPLLQATIPGPLGRHCRQARLLAWGCRHKGCSG